MCQLFCRRSKSADRALGYRNEQLTIRHFRQGDVPAVQVSIGDYESVKEAESNVHMILEWALLSGSSAEKVAR